MHTKNIIYFLANLILMIQTQFNLTCMILKPMSFKLILGDWGNYRISHISQNVSITFWTKFLEFVKKKERKLNSLLLKRILPLSMEMTFLSHLWNSARNLWSVLSQLFLWNWQPIVTSVLLWRSLEIQITYFKLELYFNGLFFLIDFSQGWII